MCTIAIIFPGRRGLCATSCSQPADNVLSTLISELRSFTCFQDPQPVAVSAYSTHIGPPIHCIVLRLCAFAKGSPAISRSISSARLLTTEVFMM
jgi:hypothetical protein